MSAPLSVQTSHVCNRTGACHSCHGADYSAIQNYRDTLLFSLLSDSDRKLKCFQYCTKAEALTFHLFNVSLQLKQLSACTLKTLKNRVIKTIGTETYFLFIDAELFTQYFKGPPRSLITPAHLFGIPPISILRLSMGMSCQHVSIASISS